MIFPLTLKVTEHQEIKWINPALLIPGSERGPSKNPFFAWSRLFLFLGIDNKNRQFPSLFFFFGTKLSGNWIGNNIDWDSGDDDHDDDDDDLRPNKRATKKTYTLRPLANFTP